MKNAIDVANQAYQQWKETSCRERSNLLRRLTTLMLENREELATIMALESGRFAFIYSR